MEERALLGKEFLFSIPDFGYSLAISVSMF